MGNPGFIPSTVIFRPFGSRSNPRDMHFRTATPKTLNTKAQNSPEALHSLVFGPNSLKKISSSSLGASVAKEPNTPYFRNIPPKGPSTILVATIVAIWAPKIHTILVLGPFGTLTYRGLNIRVHKSRGSGEALAPISRAGEHSGAAAPGRPALSLFGVYRT